MPDDPKVVPLNAGAAPQSPAPLEAGKDETPEDFARRIADREKTDVYFYSGPVSEWMYGKLINEIVKQEHPSAVLILVTRGGEPNPAYRIARLFQTFYKSFSVCVPSLCKSAGTLIAIGAHRLTMSDFGELGPLDVQLSKVDELGERRSGLISRSALQSLAEQSFEHYSSFMLGIKRASRGSVRFRTASDLAGRMATELLGSIYRQVDPVAIGEDYRDLSVALKYGQLLEKHSKNVKPGAVHRLIHDYPSHDFVICLDQAGDLFQRVSRPQAHYLTLTGLLGSSAFNPASTDDAGTVKMISAKPPAPEAQPAAPAPPVGVSDGEPQATAAPKAEP